MSLNKQPSFVGINEKAGTFTIAYLTTWYNTDRCVSCPRFRKAVTEPLAMRRVVAFCECMEADEPCEITGIRYMSEENGIET